MKNHQTIVKANPHALGTAHFASLKGRKDNFNFDFPGMAKGILFNVENKNKKGIHNIIEIKKCFSSEYIQDEK